MTRNRNRNLGDLPPAPPILPGGAFAPFPMPSPSAFVPVAPIPFVVTPGTPPPPLMPAQAFAPSAPSHSVPLTVPSVPTSTPMPSSVPAPGAPPSAPKPSAPLAPQSALSVGLPVNRSLSDTLSIPAPPLHERVYQFLQNTLFESFPDDWTVLQFILKEYTDRDIAHDAGQYQAGTVFASQMSAKYDPLIRAVQNQMSPLIDQRTALIQARIAARSAQDSQGEMDAVTKIQALQKSIDAFQAQVDDLLSQENAELEPYLKGIHTDIKALILEYIDRNPGNILLIIQDALSAKAKSAQALLNQVEAEHKAEIDQDNQAFQDFYQNKASALLQPYIDSINASQSLADQYQKMIEDKEAILNAMSSEIQSHMEALGNLIGYVAHQEGIDSPTQEQIHKILDVINGSYQGQSKITLNSCVLFMCQDMTLYEGPDAGARAITVMNLMSKLDNQTQVLNDTWVPLAKSQIKIANDAIQWNMDRYTREKENVQQSWFVTETLKEYKIKKQQDLVAKYMATGQITSDMSQAKINDFIEAQETGASAKIKIRDINAKVLSLQSQFRQLTFDLEQDVLSQQGVSIPDMSKLSYEDKRNTYFGVSNYVNTHKAKFRDVTDALNELNGEAKAGVLSASGHEHLKAANQVMLQMTCATHLKLKLEDDEDFISQLRNDKDYGKFLPVMLDVGVV